MERTLILDCKEKEKIGKEVTIDGFVQTRRDHGKIIFLDVSDRSGIIQIVVHKDKGDVLHPQDVVRITGTINVRPANMVNPALATGNIELYCDANGKIKAIFKVQSALLDGFRKAAKDLGCTEIVVPTIVAGATEGGAEVFKIDYFEHKAYLSQSPQLYKQMLVPIFERVFTIAKAYRAEPSVTTRHLTESTQMDMEIGFVEFEELLDC